MNECWNQFLIQLKYPSRGGSGIFCKERVVMRVQGKYPRAKGIGEGEGELMFKYVE